MKTYLVIITMLILLCIAVVGYGTAAWYCLIGGIVQIVDAIKAAPTSSIDIAYGIVRIICSPVVFGITTVLLIFFGGFWSVFSAPRYRRRRW